MEIHVQKCQSCNSRNLRNILAREEQQFVYVQCRQCDAFVARYILSSGGYFHAGKGYESFLRSIERNGESTSGRDMTASFGTTKEQAEQEFERIQTYVSEKYGKDIP